MFACYYNDCEQRYTCFGRALELYESPTTDPNAFPHCSIGVWAIGKITWSEDFTDKDVHRSLREFFHIDALNPELWKMYNTLIDAIVVIESPYTGPGADHDLGEPKPSQLFRINGETQVLVEKEQCAIIASSAFIEVVNEYGALCMTFPCYASNIPFLVDTLLSVLYGEMTNLEHAFQFYILMASLSQRSTFYAIPCSEITFIAMQQSGFMKMLTDTLDWHRQLTEEKFAFLNDVLGEFLGLTTLPPDARQAYFFLVHRVRVERDEKPPFSRMQFFSWIREKPTFTLSPASAPALVDVEDHITLKPKEANAMTSPEFIGYIKEHWGKVVYPVVGHEKNPDLCMGQLWDEYHSSCFPLPKPREE